MRKCFCPLQKQVLLDDSESRFQVGLLLTLDVEEDGLALDDVGVGGDAVADAAAVVAARRLLHALQHQHAGVVHRGQHQAGARVRVHPVLLQYLALKEKK